MYYDRSGRELDTLEWGRLFEDFDYRRIGRSLWWTADGGYVEISTVWVGINRNWFGDGPPLIYETMVFSTGPCDQLDELQLQWATEEGARQGHADTVAYVERFIAEQGCQATRAV